MKKRYKLIVMYPSSNNKAFTKQSRGVTVDADGCDYKGGAYRFRDKANRTIASYPINFTIIEKIESLKE